MFVALLALQLTTQAHAEPTIFTPPSPTENGTASPPSKGAPQGAIAAVAPASRAYRTFNTTAAIGTGAFLVGSLLTITSFLGCVVTGTDGACWGIPVVSFALIAVPGAVALEVGIAGTLASSRRECTQLNRALTLENTLRCNASDVGWGLYAGQLLFPPLVFGGWAAASSQHAQNKRYIPTIAVTPALGAHAGSLTFELRY